MATSQMDWDKEVKLEKLEDMITVYEEHIKTLEEENKSLKAQVVFLKEQLKYKTFGKPCYNEEVNDK
jgi:chaperonin cofactor prefoldin|tara:strand:+ start:309 stop:509 length:201 start_codon:yes stop_codon:yes gene_type:complete